ncbi:unnamed protein product [Brachionus calyciflorus]|uniref:Peptidase A2 domain-containing protein n=1 Tax=Brachionus calyciflorus TaxID=104777 RepID=A0A814LCS9_9BILA|nr:unnamed protein product [Brachionus calyciflorus]
MNYYPHVVAVIAITLLIYVVRKKGRPAYNPIRLFTVWFESKKCNRAEVKRVISAPNIFKRDGISFDIWIQLFETYACQYNKNDWKSLLLMLIDQQLLNEIQFEQSMTYDELKMVLGVQLRNRQHGRKEPNIVAAMENFTKCFKGREESIEDFLSRFLSFADKAEINKESTLVSYFINNLQNQQMEQFIRQSVSLYQSIANSDEDIPLSLATIVKYAKAYEYASPTDLMEESSTYFESEAAINSVTKTPTDYRQESNYKSKKPFQTQNVKSNRYNNNYQNESFRKNEAATTNKKQEDSKDNVHNKSLVCTISNSDFTSSRIEGIALMDGVKISFLCDSGADETILSESGYKKINEKRKSVELKKYIGPNLNSALIK